MMKNCFWIITAVLFVAQTESSNDDFDNLKLLHYQISQKSHPFIPPANFSDSNIYLYLHLYQISDVNEKRGTKTMKLTKLVFYSYEDIYWNPSEYGGMKTLFFPLGTFWSPIISE